jgi:hypothetical protein
VETREDLLESLFDAFLHQVHCATGLAWVWGVVWVWVGVVGAVSVGGGVLSLRGGEVGHRYDQATCSWSNTRINLRWTCRSHTFPAFVELVPSVV